MSEGEVEGLQGPWKGKEAVMGFFWAKAADCDFVIVTKAGLEIYTLLGTRQGLRHSTRCSHPVKWWMYSHDTRICLLGTGDIGLWLQVPLPASPPPPLPCCTV